MSGALIASSLPKTVAVIKKCFPYMATIPGFLKKFGGREMTSIGQSALDVGTDVSM